MAISKAFDIAGIPALRTDLYYVFSGFSFDADSGTGSITATGYLNKAQATAARARLADLVAHRDYMEKQASNELREKLLKEQEAGALNEGAEIPEAFDIPEKPPLVPDAVPIIDKQTIEVPLRKCVQLVAEFKTAQINLYGVGYALLNETEQFRDGKAV